MTPYYESLPPVVKERLRPLLPVMQQAARAQGIPVDSLISLAVKESGGRADSVGDRELARPAKGLYQVRYPQEWLGGADPMDPAAATQGLAPRVKKLLDECKGDMACLHFKFNAGPGQAYTPENVARISKKFPHVDSRLKSIQASFATDPGAVAQAQPQPQPQLTPAAPLPPQTTLLGLTPQPAAANPMAASWDIPQQEPDSDFFDQLAASMVSTGADTGGRVKSKKPTTSLFGL
jgi:hypothetical protein